MSKRYIMFDQINAEISADAKLTTEQRREVLKFCREFPDNLQVAVADLIPTRLVGLVKIKVSK